MTRSAKSLLRKRKHWDDFWMKLKRGRTQDRIEQEDREVAARLLNKIHQQEKKAKEEDQP